MIYAIPCQNNHVSNHFSRAPQVVIFDQDTGAHQLITLVETSSNCGKKKQWMEIFNTYHVDAVVVRLIGKKMLAGLFTRNLNVFAAAPKADISQLDYASLLPVTNLDYGKEPKKSNGCCGSQKPQANKASLLMPLPKALILKPSLKKGLAMIKRIA